MGILRAAAFRGLDILSLVPIVRNWSWGCEWGSLCQFARAGTPFLLNRGQGVAVAFSGYG